MHKVRNEEVLKAFGANLRRIRKEKKFTQEELAYKSGIAFSSIVRIEQGQLNTTISTVAKLAETLEIEKKLLFDF